MRPPATPRSCFNDGTQKTPATIALTKPKATNRAIMSIFRVRLIGSLLG